MPTTHDGASHDRARTEKIAQTTQRWIDANCDVGHWHESTSSALFTSWDRWRRAQPNGTLPLRCNRTLAGLVRQLGTMGYERVRVGRHRGLAGLCVRPDAPVAHGA